MNTASQREDDIAWIKRHLRSQQQQIQALALAGESVKLYSQTFDLTVVEQDIAVASAGRVQLLMEFSSFHVTDALVTGAPGSSLSIVVRDNGDVLIPDSEATLVILAASRKLSLAHARMDAVYLGTGEPIGFKGTGAPAFTAGGLVVTLAYLPIDAGATLILP